MKYVGTISTHLYVTVPIEAESEEKASDQAWELAQKYAQTLHGDAYVSAEADFNGVHVDVEEASE